MTARTKRSTSPHSVSIAAALVKRFVGQGCAVGRWAVTLILDPALPLAILQSEIEAVLAAEAAGTRALGGRRPSRAEASRLSAAEAYAHPRSPASVLRTTTRSLRLAGPHLLSLRGLHDVEGVARCGAGRDLKRQRTRDVQGHSPRARPDRDLAGAKNPSGVAPLVIPSRCHTALVQDVRSDCDEP